MWPGLRRPARRPPARDHSCQHPRGQPAARAASRGTAIFTFRVALDPPQSGFTFRNGQTAIDVTAETLPSRTVIGLDPAAKAPVSVVTR